MCQDNGHWFHSGQFRVGWKFRQPVHCEYVNADWFTLWKYPWLMALYNCKFFMFTLNCVLFITWLKITQKPLCSLCVGVIFHFYTVEVKSHDIFISCSYIKMKEIGESCLNWTVFNLIFWRKVFQKHRQICFSLF